jgi:hypothetical protein
MWGNYQRMGPTFERFLESQIFNHFSSIFITIFFYNDQKQLFYFEFLSSEFWTDCIYSFSYARTCVDRCSHNLDTKGRFVVCSTVLALFRPDQWSSYPPSSSSFWLQGSHKSRVVPPGRAGTTLGRYEGTRDLANNCTSVTFYSPPAAGQLSQHAIHANSCTFYRHQ